MERREDSSVEPDVDPVVPGRDHVERHEWRQRLETRPPNECRVQAVGLSSHGEASCSVAELDRPLERLAEHRLAIESGQDAGAASRKRDRLAVVTEARVHRDSCGHAQPRPHERDDEVVRVDLVETLDEDGRARLRVVECPLPVLSFREPVAFQSGKRVLDCRGRSQQLPARGRFPAGACAPRRVAGGSGSQTATYFPFQRLPYLLPVAYEDCHVE